MSRAVNVMEEARGLLLPKRGWPLLLQTLQAERRSRTLHYPEHYQVDEREVGDRMPIFISHSFNDKAEFDNVADALERDGIEVWKPEAMTAGAPLSDQLRQSILSADLCVFVATRHSVKSGWCGAELGAFWVTQKPVIIYIAESSLGKEKLPEQFNGNLFVRKIRDVVEAVRSHLECLKQAAQAPDDTTKPLTLAETSSEDLKLLISEAVVRAQNVGFVESTLIRLAFAVSSDDVLDREIRHLQELLRGLLGVQSTILREGARRTEWKHGFGFSTDTGDWSGLGKHYENPDKHRGNAPVDLIHPCLVWRSGDNQQVEAVGLLKSVTDHWDMDIVSLGSVIALVGRGSLGGLKVG